AILRTRSSSRLPIPASLAPQRALGTLRSDRALGPVRANGREAEFRDEGIAGGHGDRPASRPFCRRMAGVGAQATYAWCGPPSGLRPERTKLVAGSSRQEHDGARDPPAPGREALNAARRRTLRPLGAGSATTSVSARRAARAVVARSWSR